MEQKCHENIQLIRFLKRDIFLNVFFFFVESLIKFLYTVKTVFKVYMFLFLV